MKMPKPIAKAKDKWDQQPKSKKKGIIIIALSVLAIIVLAIVITAIINASKPGYKVLYSGLDPQETTEVHAALQEMGVSTEMNNKGEIMVPTEQYDNLLLQLAAKGYPQSAPTYDIWTNSNSMTATDTDKKTALVYQLQNRAANNVDEAGRRKECDCQFEYSRREQLCVAESHRRQHCYR